MAESQAGADGTATVPPSGKVNNVRQKWLVYEDGALAHNEQEKEFGSKYDWNRKDRQTARKDVPLARVVETEEEARKQREAMARLERNRDVAQQDAVAAEKLMSEMILEEQRNRIARQMQDERVAAVLQESEKKKFEQKMRERALAKERGRGGNSASLEAQRRLRSDGKVEDLGDFSDFYIPPDHHMDENEAKHLREMQDEELARLLQDQEHKRGANVDKDKMAAIEAQDEELAIVMQEQEKLRVQRRQQKLAAKRQMSQPTYTSQSPVDEYPAQRSHSDRGRVDHSPRGDYPSQGDYDPRVPHQNGHNPPGGRDRMSPLAEHAPAPPDMRSGGRAQDNFNYMRSGEAAQDNYYNDSRGGDEYYNQSRALHQEREPAYGRGREEESLQREADGSRRQAPSPPGGANRQQERPDSSEGNVFSSIDPTAGRTRAPPGNASPQQPYPPQHTYSNGDEAGYEELGDLAVVQAQKRELSKRGSSKKGSKKDKGQCKQQ